MLHALIVSSHPNPQSFNHALVKQTFAELLEQGWSANQSNLYQSGFNPLLSAEDIAGNSAEDVKIEQSKLLQADLVILQFPLWWGSFPAMLKGWIDRVCASGFAYGSHRQLAGKRLLLSVTTGGAADENEHRLYLEKVRAMAAEVFGYMAMDCLEPILSHGPANAVRAEREALLTVHKNRVIELCRALK